MKPSTNSTIDEELARLRGEYRKTHHDSTSINPFYIVSAILFLILLIGWIANIVQVYQAAQDPVTTWIVVKIVGIFFLIPGAIFGWIGMI